MQNLCENNVFAFISNLYGWDSSYQQHIAQCYSNYTDEDSALSAICADYSLDLSTIQNAVSESSTINNPIHKMMSSEICDRILSVILKSQCTPVRRMIKRHRDMSGYKLKYSYSNVYSIVYYDYDNGSIADVGSLSAEFNCMVRSWREEQLHKKGDIYLGWVNLYNQDIIIYFKIKFKY